MWALNLDSKLRQLSVKRSAAGNFEIPLFAKVFWPVIASYNYLFYNLRSKKLLISI